MPGAAAISASHSAGVAGGFFRVATDFMLLCLAKTDDVRLIASLRVGHVHDDAFKPPEQVDSLLGLNEGLGISDEQCVLTPREQPSEVSIEGDQMLAELNYGRG